MTAMRCCIQVGQGAGYMYMHQGCCEHLLELKDVRSIQATDPTLASAFPFMLSQVHAQTCDYGMTVSVMMLLATMSLVIDNEGLQGPSHVGTSTSLSPGNHDTSNCQILSCSHPAMLCGCRRGKSGGFATCVRVLPLSG